MQSVPFAPPASRNAPCPCGSGRRYKECHGALGVGSETRAAPPALPSRVDRMYAALAAQQANRLLEAGALYRSVVGEDPANFDALHMLGVIEYELGHFSEAESLLRRALEILPRVAAAHGNLRLIREGRKRADAEQQLCRELLPRLEGLCSGPSVPRAAEGGRGVTTVIGCGVDEISVTQQLPALEAAGAAMRWWRWRDGPPIPPLGSVVEAWDGVQRLPPTASLLYVGTAVPAAPWVAALDPARVMLLSGSGFPCRLVDRIRELSDEGRRKVELIYADADAAAMATLPGPIVPTNDPGPWWRAELGIRP